jgi:hypothetical protein
MPTMPGANTERTGVRRVGDDVAGAAHRPHILWSDLYSARSNAARRDWRDGRRARPSGGDARPSIYKTTDVSASLFLDAEIIGHRENIGNAFGLHLGNLFVHLTSDHTFQCDVTILDDDVDRRDCAQCIHT